MTDFEQKFLVCSAAGIKASFSYDDNIFFGPGPQNLLEPDFNFSAGFVDYPAAEIAKSISSIPSISLRAESAFQSVWRWDAQNDRFIEINVTDDNTGPDDGVWLASGLHLNCTFADVVEFWTLLAEGHPAVYLHDWQSRIYTRCSFLEEIALPALSAAFRNPDSSVRHRAVEEFHRYSALSHKPRISNQSWGNQTFHMAKSLFDLTPPVASLRCKDFWRGDTWVSQIETFDKESHRRGLAYFAYSICEVIEQKHYYGFMVWVQEDQLELATDIACTLGILAI